MAVYAIGDLHLALGCNKPMDIFSGWQDYVQRLEQHWLATIKPEDVVVLAGDTSWAMKLEEGEADFAFIHRLPGKKYLIKGNHDYWWSTRAKMERFFTEKGFFSLSFIHNDSVLAETEDGPPLALCGTRSWLFEPNEPHDAKVMARETGRLAASLQHAEANWPEAEKVVFLHYPPIFPGARSDEVVALLQQYGVQRCYYGHLHGKSIKRAVQGVQGGIDYALISADALAFQPEKITP